MSSLLDIYKSDLRVENVSSSNFKVDYLKDLLVVLGDINEKAKLLEIAAINKSEEQTEEDFEKFKEYVNNLVKLEVMIWGENGEFLMSENSSVFDNTTLPTSISKIIFDNSNSFNFTAKRNPRNSFKIVLDFTRKAVFDFSINISAPTENESLITVNGENEEWVELSFKKIKSSLSQHKNNRDWLHNLSID